MSLQSLGIENLPVWMESMFEILGQKILFVTHPDDAGSADTGPLFRLKPTQVVAYELFSVARHTAADANEGDGSSVTIHRMISVDVNGDPELSGLISGSLGVGQADTNMPFLQDEVTVGAPQIDIGYNSDVGTTTDNTIPGIWAIPLSLDSFGDNPEVEIEAHTHEDNTEGGTLGSVAFIYTDTSFAGSIGAGTWVTFLFNAYSFFPMVHTTGARQSAGLQGGPRLAGHDVDGASADSPRCALSTDALQDGTYDIDIRNIQA